MAGRVFLVPVDFSKGSEAALDLAIKLAKDERGKLLLVHVISVNFAFPLEVGFADIFETLERNARDSMERLVRRKRLKPAQYKALLITGINPAEAIAAAAKKNRAAMIVMGSHGRSGFQRLMLGSV